MSQTANRALRRCSRLGQTIVEFAIIATVLFILLFAIIQMGIVVYDYNMVSSAAREAVRYAIVHPADTTGIKNAAINSAPFLTTSNIAVNCSLPNINNLSSRNDCLVTISYPYPLYIPLVPLSFTFITLSSTSRMLTAH